MSFVQWLLVSQLYYRRSPFLFPSIVWLHGDTAPRCLRFTFWSDSTLIPSRPPGCASPRLRNKPLLQPNYFTRIEQEAENFASPPLVVSTSNEKQNRDAVIRCLIIYALPITLNVSSIFHVNFTKFDGHTSSSHAVSENTVEFWCLCKFPTVSGPLMQWEKWGGAAASLLSQIKH